MRAVLLAESVAAGVSNLHDSSHRCVTMLSFHRAGSKRCIAVGGIGRSV